MKMRIKRFVKGFSKNTNAFVLTVIGVLLAMLPTIASVFGGMMLKDALSGWDQEQIAIAFFTLVILTALLTFLNIKKKLHIRK